MWSRLVALYRIKHYAGDVQIQGRNWAEDWLPGNGHHSDLGTNARLLFIASVGALTRLEEQGIPQTIGVRMARRRLNAQRVSDIRRKHGLSYEEGMELEHMVREWLCWALGDEPENDEPELPWPGTDLTTVRRLTGVVQ